MMQFDVNAVNALLSSLDGPTSLQIMRDLSGLDALYEIYPTVLTNLLMTDQNTLSAIELTNTFHDKLVKLLSPTNNISDLKWIQDTLDTFENGWCWSPRFQCKHNKIGQLSTLTILNIADRMSNEGFNRYDTVDLIERIETWCPNELSELVQNFLCTHELQDDQFDRLCNLALLIADEVC